MDIANFKADTNAVVGLLNEISKTFTPNWGVIIFAVGLLGLIFVVFEKQILRRVSSLFGATSDDAPATPDNTNVNLLQPSTVEKSRAADRQPINHAYEYLVSITAYEDEGNYIEEIVHTLRQAALDEEIIIWGAKEPSTFEDGKPTLIKIHHDEWKRFEIDATQIWEKVEDLQEGHEAYVPRNSDLKYYHLQVDMIEVKERWPIEKFQVPLRDCVIEAYERVLAADPANVALLSYQDQPEKLPKLAAEMLINNADPPIRITGVFPPLKTRKPIIDPEIPEQGVSNIWVVNDGATEMHSLFDDKKRFTDVMVNRVDLERRTNQLIEGLSKHE